MGAEAGKELGKPWWGKQVQELPPDLCWGCWCCCCDLVKHEGLIWQAVECWNCWESRALIPAWLYNQLSTQHPALVYGAGLVFLLYSHAQQSCCLYAWMSLHDCNMHALLSFVGKDEPSCRFDLLGLTSDSLAADAAPVQFLVLSKENKKHQPCLICFCTSSWSGLDFIQVFMLLYSSIPTKLFKKKRWDPLKCCKNTVKKST